MTTHDVIESEIEKRVQAYGESYRDILPEDTVERSKRAWRRELTSFATRIQEAERGKVLKVIETAKIRGKKKPYDGDDLQSANNVYEIAAESWAEIIRFEDGHDAALYGLEEVLSPQPKEDVTNQQ